MKAFKLFMLGLFLVGTPLFMTACEQENSVEEAVEEVGDEIDDATTN